MNGYLVALGLSGALIVAVFTSGMWVPIAWPDRVAATGIIQTPQINTVLVATLIHSMVNDERRDRGLSELDYNSELAAVAKAHTVDMQARGYYDHINPEGLDPTARAKAAGYNCGIGENIFIIYLENTDGTSSGLAKEAFNGWMASSGHRENMLNSIYKSEGIGVHMVGNDVYLAQNLSLCP